MLSGAAVPIVVLRRHFIAYIVDLIIVLQTLSFVSDNQEVTRRTIKLVVAAYSNSSTVKEVHDRIKKYAESLPLLNRLDREKFAMVEELVNEFWSEIQELGADIPVISPQPDEPW